MHFFDHITDFIFHEDAPCEADFIMIPGSGYGELALHAAKLYLNGYAKRVIISGKYSTLGKEFAGPVSPAEYVGKRYETEADFLGSLVKEKGVKKEDIILEKEATFTYENALYIRKKLQEKKMWQMEKTYRALLVCQAFHARRSLMYFEYVFPNISFYVCPVATQGITKDTWQDTAHGRKTVLGEVVRCGTQLEDILSGNDRIWSRILKEKQS